MRIEFSPEELQQILSLVEIRPTHIELPDYEDISDLELAVNKYAESSVGKKYTVTVKRMWAIIDRLKELNNGRWVGTKES